jgi:4'-phosphopantetheinyl transferase
MQYELHCSAQDFRLTSHEVHLWVGELEAHGAELPRLAETLSPDELARAACFRFHRDREQFIVSRGLLRAILAKYLRIAPEALRFCYGAFGQPMLAQGAIKFSVAHTAGVVIHAFTLGRRIGIDIECLERTAEADELVECHFTPAERINFHALCPEQKRKAFFRGWTRKEAYLKATGEGLTRPLSQIEVRPAATPPAMLLLTDGRREAGWSFWELAPVPGYLATVVAQGTGLRLASRELPACTMVPLHPHS